MENIKGIGKRLRTLRENNHLSQVSVGDWLGIKGPSVSAYESGSANPSPKTLAMYAERFGVTIDWIVTGKEKNTAEKITREAALEQIAAAAYQGDKTFAAKICEAAGLYQQQPDDPGTRELLAIYRRLPPDDQLSLLKTARGIDMVNESRRNAGGGSESAERNSA